MCYKNGRKILFPKRNPWISCNHRFLPISKSSVFYWMECLKMQISKFYANTWEPKSRYHFKLVVDSEHVSGLKTVSGNFWTFNVPESIFSLIKTWQNNPIRAKYGWKQLFVTFAIFITADEHDCKPDDILWNDKKIHFWKIVVVLVLFDFEICVLMCLFSLIFKIKNQRDFCFDHFLDRVTFISPPPKCYQATFMPQLSLLSWRKVESLIKIIRIMIR